MLDGTTGMAGIPSDRHHCDPVKEHFSSYRRKSGHFTIKRHTFYINKNKKGKGVGEGTEIGTDIDILLSSFNATDANHETPGEIETRAGFSFF